LVDRRPPVSPELLIAQLTPPPTFAEATFASYHPDPAEPTQAAAVVACQRFCEQTIEHQ
jgi:cell division protein ZapE